MRHLLTRSLAALPLAALLTLGACAPTPGGPEPGPSISCNSRAIAQGMTAFSPADVGVYFETAGDPGLEVARAGVGSYLAELWGGAFPVLPEAPDFSKRATVWLSTSDAAGAKAGLDPDKAYAIRRVDDAAGTV